tara:strand:- start:1841 stop:2188 length:348 start_codon:yes stop_codon:yes gene_type:complete
MSTMIEASAPTDIAGRYALQIQRENFAKLEARMWISTDATALRIPNKAMLSPRRIARLLQTERGLKGTIATPIADMTYKLMRDWRYEGFPDLNYTQPFTGTVGFWNVMLTYGEAR